MSSTQSSTKPSATKKPERKAQVKTPKRPSTQEYLDTLLPIKSGEREPNGFKMIDPARIEVGTNVRQTVSEGDLADTRESIHELRQLGEGIEGTGILQAILVTPDGDGYRLVVGQKRLLSATALSLEEVPCIVVQKVTEGAIRLMQLTENAQRTPPPPLEEATAIQAMMTEQKLSYRDVARLLGKRKGYVENRINLLKMGADVQKMVSVRTDTLQHARLIDPIEDAALRRQLIHAVTKEEVGEREIRRRIEAYQEEIAEAAVQEQAAQQQATTSVSGNGTGGASSSGGSPNVSLGNGSGISTGRSSTPAPTATPTPVAAPDPIGQSLRPAVSFIAEGVRQLKAMKLTAANRQAARQELQLLKAQITELEKVLD